MRSSPFASPLRPGRHPSVTWPVVGTVLWVVLLPLPVAAQRLWLQTRIEAGMDLRYEVSQTLRMEPVPGLGGVNQFFRAVVRHRVSAADEPGLFRLRTTVESIELDASTPLGVERYDSRRDPAPQGGQAARLAELVGRETERLVRADGTPLPETQGPPPGGGEGQIPPFPPPGAALGGLEVMAGLARLLLDGGISPFSIAPWPRDSVALGGSWENTSSVTASGAGSASFGARYFLARLEEFQGRRTAVVEGELTLSVAPDLALPPEIGRVVQAPGKVRLRLDLDRGVLLEWELRNDLSLTVLGTPLAVFSTLELRLVD